MLPVTPELTEIKAHRTSFPATQSTMHSSYCFPPSITLSNFTSKSQHMLKKNGKSYTYILYLMFHTAVVVRAR